MKHRYVMPDLRRITLMPTTQPLNSCIPPSKCPPGCGDCCGPVPVSKEEAAAIGLPAGSRITPFNRETLTCDFFSPEKGCTVYDNRPFMCRIFGAVKTGDLACDRCRSGYPKMPETRAKVMLDHYRRHSR